MDDAQLTWNLAHDLHQLFQYPFMQNAFAAGTIVGVMCGIIGYFMVLRGQSFAGHTLSQVGFPGAAGATLVGVAPLYGLVAFCVVAAVSIGAMGSSVAGARRHENAAIGSILVFALALGLLFARLYHGFAGETYSFLFGTFLGITTTEVLALLAIAVAVVTIVGVLARPLLFSSLEPDVAAARGVPVQLLSYCFLVLLGLAVASTATITGTLLVFALLVTPAATAQQLTARPVLGIALSVLLALAVTWLGLAIAYFSIYPLGFYVTTLSFALYLLVRLARQSLARFGRRPIAVPDLAAT